MRRVRRRTGIASEVALLLGLLLAVAAQNTAPGNASALANTTTGAAAAGNSTIHANGTAPTAATTSVAVLSVRPSTVSAADQALQMQMTVRGGGEPPSSDPSQQSHVYFTQGSCATDSLAKSSSPTQTASVALAVDPSTQTATATVDWSGSAAGLFRVCVREGAPGRGGRWEDSGVTVAVQSLPADGTGFGEKEAEDEEANDEAAAAAAATEEGAAAGQGGEAEAGGAEAAGGEAADEDGEVEGDSGGGEAAAAAAALNKTSAAKLAGNASATPKCTSHVECKVSPGDVRQRLDV